METELLALIFLRPNLINLEELHRLDRDLR